MLPFAKSVRYGIVNCDDYDYANYRQLTEGVTADSVRWAFTFKDEGIWMPLTWLSYMHDYALAGAWMGETDKFSPDAYHVMHAHSIVLHGLNASLLFVLLALLAGRGNWALAALAALFWAVHPLRCESVDWIASRKDVLSMVGLLASLVCWVRWRQSVSRPMGMRAAWYAASVLACAVGGLAKPSVMCYPILAAILDWFFLRRDVRTQDDVGRLCLAYIAPAGLAVALGVSAYVMQGVGGCTVEFSDMPFFARALNAAVSFGVYVFHTLCPTGLAAQCIMRWPHPPRLMLPGLIAAGLLVWKMAGPCRLEFLRLRGAFTDRAVEGAETSVLPMVAGGIWYALSIVPFLGLSGFGWHAMADRFTYIPAVGASVAILSLARIGQKRRLWCAALAVVTVVFGVLTERQTGIWRDDGTFWERTIAVDGIYNGAATAGLGLWHYEHGHDLDKVVLNYNQAFDVSSDFVQKTCFLYVDALAKHGDLERAYEVMKWTSEFSRSIREQEMKVKGLLYEGGKPMMHNRLARVACFLRDPQFKKTAEAELAELKVDAPKSIHVWYMVAEAALLNGDVHGAEEAWQKIQELATRRDYVRYRFLPAEIDRMRAVKNQK